MTPLSTTLSLCRSSLAHARMAMLRAAEVLEPDMADRLRVQAESLEDMEVTLAMTEARAVLMRAEVMA